MRINKKEEYELVSFKKYSGHSLNELPPPEAIKYFKPYFDRERIEDEDTAYRCDGIYEQVARISKASQFVEWIMHNVLRTDTIPQGGEAYEITREQLEQLLEACNLVRRYGITCTRTNEHTHKFEEGYYKVNEPVARAILPIREQGDKLMWPYGYNCHYAEQIISAIRVLNEILATTNFKTQSIYFQYG